MLTSTAPLPAVVNTSSPLVTACQSALALKNINSSSCLSCLQTCKGSSTTGCTQNETNCAMGCSMQNPTTDGVCSCVDHCLVSDQCRQAATDEYNCMLNTCGAACG
jgi:hypothetical protein